MAGTLGRAALARIVTDYVSPRLKALGFRKRGNTLFRIDETSSVQVSFQGWWTDSAIQGQVNVFMGIVWHKAEGLRPRSVKAVPRAYYKCTGYTALHNIHAWKRSWWTINSRTDVDAVGREVAAALDNYVTRWFAAGEQFVETLATFKRLDLATRKWILSMLMSGVMGIGPHLETEHQLPRDLISALARIAKKTRFRLCLNPVQKPLYCISP
jgi:hypothetical protein